MGPMFNIKLAAVINRSFALVEPSFGVRISMFILIAFILIVFLVLLYLRMQEVDKQSGIK